MASSSSDFREPSSDDDVVVQAPHLRRRVPVLRERGGPFVLAVLADTDLSGDTLPKHECTVDQCFAFAGARYWLLGLLSISWDLVRDRASDCKTKVLNGMSKRFRAVDVPFAWVDYVVDARSGLVHVQTALLDLTSRYMVCREIRSLVGASNVLNTFLAGTSLGITEFIVVGPMVGHCFLNGCCQTLTSLPVLQKNIGWPFTSHPNFESVRHHVTSSRESSFVGQPVRHAFRRVHMPVKTCTFLIDPLVYMRFIDATSYIKTFTHIVDAANSMVRALWPGTAQRMVDELLASGFEFPSRPSLARARPRFDAACMGLERADWSCGIFTSLEFLSMFSLG
jgi:hypothetical protein